MVRRPLLALATAFAVGTAVGLHGDVPSLILIPALAVLMGLLVLFRLQSGAGASLRPLPFIGWLVAAAALGLVSASRRSPPSSIATSTGPIAQGGSVGPTRTTLIGTIGSSPVWVGSETTTTWLFSLSLAATGPWERVEVLWHNPSTPFPPSPGETWHFSGLFTTHARPRLRLFGRAGRPLPLEQQGALTRAILPLRRFAAEALSRGFEQHPTLQGLIRALVLGDRSSLSPHLRTLFRWTGVLHIIAISGLHVGIMAWLLSLPLRAIRLSRLYWLFVLAPLLILYTAMAGAPASAVRACVMALLFFAAPLLGRPPDGLSSISAAALLILAWDPGQIAEPGFLLSFAIAGGLIAVAPLLTLTTPQWLLRDPWQLPEQDNRWWALLQNLGRHLWQLVIVSAAAWLIAMPLTARLFGQLSLLTLPANLAAIPAAFLLVTLGALSLAAAIVAPIAVPWINRLALWVAFLLVRSMETLAALPWGFVRVPKPPLATVILWYLLLVAVARFLYSKTSRMKMNVTP